MSNTMTPHLKLAGVRIRCPKCNKCHPVAFTDSRVSCSCGTAVELPDAHKEYYVNKFNTVGHT